MQAAQDGTPSKWFKFLRVQAVELVINYLARTSKSCLGGSPIELAESASAFPICNCYKPALH